jgi:hypothetical protein
MRFKQPPYSKDTRKKCVQQIGLPVWYGDPIGMYENRVEAGKISEEKKKSFAKCLGILKEEEILEPEVEVVGNEQTRNVDPNNTKLKEGLIFLGLAFAVGIIVGQKIKAK